MEAVLLERAKSKEAELEAERWAEQSRNLQSEAVAHSQEITQLKQDRQKNQEAINRSIKLLKIKLFTPQSSLIISCLKINVKYAMLLQ